MGKGKTFPFSDEMVVIRHGHDSTPFCFVFFYWVLPGFYLVLPSFGKFRVLLGFTLAVTKATGLAGFPWFSFCPHGRYLVLPSCYRNELDFFVDGIDRTEFYRVSIEIVSNFCYVYRVFTQFYLVSPSLIGLYRVLPSFTEFYWVALCFTVMYCVFTQFYLVSPSCIGLYYALPGCIGFLTSFTYFHQV